MLTCPVTPPQVDKDAPFATCSQHCLNSDPYLGRCLVGRVVQGSATVNDSVRVDMIAKLLKQAAYQVVEV